MTRKLPLKWAGGKSRLAVLIARTIERQTPWSAVSTYCETHCGAAGLFWYLRENSLLPNRTRVILADLNPDLLCFWRAVRDNPSGLWAGLQELPRGPSQEEYRDLADAFRQGQTGSADDLTHAVLFLWLNRACFNGLFRVNSSGLFNAPRGDSADVLARCPSLEQLQEYSAGLQGVELHCRAATVSLAFAREGWVVYCDPEYPESGTRYTAAGFDLNGERRTVRHAWKAARRGALVYFSNRDCSTARELYQGAQVCWPSAVSDRNIIAKKASQKLEQLWQLGGRDEPGE